MPWPDGLTALGRRNSLDNNMNSQLKIMASTGWTPLLTGKTNPAQTSPKQPQAVRLRAWSQLATHASCLWDEVGPCPGISNTDYNADVMALHITDNSTVCPTVCSGWHHRKDPRPLVKEIHRWPVDILSVDRRTQRNKCQRNLDKNAMTFIQEDAFENAVRKLWRQAITWPNAGLLSIRLLGTSFSKIWIGII